MAKTDQIIIRLLPEQKEKLQKISDRLKISMSDLIRPKIDEIIDYHENKRLYDEEESFIKDMSLNDKIIDYKMIEELKEEFRKAFMEKMLRDIEEVNLARIIIDDKDKM